MLIIIVPIQFWFQEHLLFWCYIPLFGRDLNFEGILFKHLAQSDIYVHSHNAKYCQA